jgi:OmpA-OmpF porin, OOP family
MRLFFFAICFCLSVIPSLAQVDGVLMSYEKIPLGEAINSDYTEICPLISPDGNTLYFVRVNHPENNYKNKCKREICTQDIWYADVKEDGSWDKARRMPEPFNKNDFNSIISVSSDGFNLLVRGGMEAGEHNPYKLAVSHRNKLNWSEPKVLKIKNYESLNKGSFDGGCFANDNTVLILFFNDVNDTETTNLYISFLKEDGSWSSPKKMGKNINQGSQISPFMAADNKTLYYASDMPGGFGEYDIYMTQRLDESWMKWSDPVNLGSSINSDQWEGYYSVDVKGEHAYMVSTNNASGTADIVKIRLKEENKPSPMAVVFGKILLENIPYDVKGVVSCEIIGKDKSITKVNLDSDNSFKFNLHCGLKYRLHAEIEGFVSVSEIVDLTDVKEYAEIDASINIRLIPMKDNFDDLKALSFLAENKIEALNKLVLVLIENPSMVIELKDFPAASGVGIDNRVKTLKKYLVSQGINEDRIKIKAMADLIPLASE